MHGLLDDRIRALAGIQHHVRAHVAAHGDTAVARIDRHDLQPLRARELDAQVPEPTAAADDAQPLPRGEAGVRDRAEDGAPGARQRRRGLEADRVRDAVALGGVGDHVRGERARARHAGDGPGAGAVVPLVRRAAAVGARAAELGLEGGHAAVAERPGRDVAAQRDDGAGALVRGGAR